MTRDEFMKELAYLLQDIQDEDKEDALQYYMDYFDEAGPDREADVVRELGSPERIASIIRSDIAGNLKDGGEFTESGYKDERFRDPNYQVVKRFDLPEANEQAVYARMISERNQIAEKYTADGEYEASIIRNDVDKQVNIIVSNARAEAAKLEAEGEQEYMRILAEAYDSDEKKDFYEFTLALDALKASLNGDEKTLILGPDSPLAEVLLNQ